VNDAVESSSAENRKAASAHPEVEGSNPSPATIKPLRLAHPPIAQGNLFDVMSPDRGIGIHCTDPSMIRKLIDPLVIRPLRDEW
jgi:hypothetical protein